MFDAKTLTLTVLPDLNHNDLAMVANRVDDILTATNHDPAAGIQILMPLATGDKNTTGYHSLMHERRRDAMALAVLGAALIGERLAEIADNHDDDDDIQIKQCYDCNGIHDMPGDRCPVCSQ